MYVAPRERHQKVRLLDIPQWNGFEYSPFFNWYVSLPPAPPLPVHENIISHSTRKNHEWNPERGVVGRRNGEENAAEY